MPGGSHQAPILSSEASARLDGLRRALAPQRWPLDPALLPAGTLLVGGAVRDALLGRLRPTPDLDLVVEGDAVALARGLARRCGGSCVVLDAERSIARLVLGGWSFDLARRMGGSLAQDLARRDYSVNAIALPLTALWTPAATPAATDAEAGSGDTALSPHNRAAPATPAADAMDGVAGGCDGLLDPCGGLADLRARQLRALGEANLLEDPLRLLRGVRLACELQFTIEPRTLDWIRRHHRRLSEVAGERVLAELERLAAAPRGGEGLGAVLELGLLQGWQPGSAAQERDQDPDNGGPQETPERRLAQLTPEHARRCGLETGEQVWALPLARLAAVLPVATLQRLRASRRLQQRCRRLRQWQRRLEACAASSPVATPAATDAAAPGQAPSGPLSLANLAEAERLALQRELEHDLPALLLQLPPAEARAALERWRDADDPLFHPRSPLNGEQLQRLLDLPAGRMLGALLAHLTQERAFGRLRATDGSGPALQLAQRWLAAQAREGSGTSENGQAP